METAAAKLIEHIFSEALSRKDDAARESYVTQACRGDIELFEEVKQLIAAHENAAGFLTEAAQAEVVLAPAAATIIGRDPVERSAQSSEVEERRETVFDDPTNTLATKISRPEISGFQIERLLGKGGLGVVYQAFDEKLQRQVALKVLLVGKSVESRKRVLAEARKAASLIDPGIVTIYSVHDEGTTPAVSMELVEGFPIDRATLSLTVEQKARILQQVAAAVSVAHRSGVIHRDLKPENVMVTPDLRAKILDFGLAISFEEAGTGQRFFEGTPRYASPEQVAGKPLTPASDIFSLGSLMYKVLTGRPPFDGQSTLEILEALCTSEPPFLKDVAVGVPEDLQAICLACLAWRPEDRPTANEVAIDLGRFLSGEPVRLRPALYGDILRRRITEYSMELSHWKQQGMISSGEKDRLDAVHRRILADEDHWIIDARKVSIAQTILYTGSWLVVVSTVLTVWLARNELNAPFRWLAPVTGTFWLLVAGFFGARRRESIASASFLAGAVLSLVPTTLALLQELQFWSMRPKGITQLLPDFSNAQLLAASLTSLGLSAIAWRRLRMTGFAWTTALLAVATYWSFLLCAGWLDKKPEIAALWLLPLIALEAPALICEGKGRVRWSLPFHWIAFLVLVGTLDVMALQGPYFAMVGFGEGRFSFLNLDRQRYFSLALNGYFFLALMLISDRSKSLDLRRASRILESLALLHMLGPLYLNARAQRGNPLIGFDVSLYLGTVVLLFWIGPWKSLWRVLVGALGGVALGSYLLIDLELVRKSVFALSIGLIGLIGSTLTYLYLLRSEKSLIKKRASKLKIP